MTQDHKLFTTPVSVNDGFKRGDSRTWIVLLIGAAVALVIVAAINLLVEKPKIRWPSSPAQPSATAPAPAEPAKDETEPRTFDVAPRGAVPPKSR